MSSNIIIIILASLSQWGNTTEHHVKTSTGILVIFKVFYILHSTFYIYSAATKKKRKACIKLLSMHV